MHDNGGVEFRGLDYEAGSGMKGSGPGCGVLELDVLSHFMCCACELDLHGVVVTNTTCEKEPH